MILLSSASIRVHSWLKSVLPILRQDDLPALYPCFLLIDDDLVAGLQSRKCFHPLAVRFTELDHLEYRVPFGRDDIDAGDARQSENCRTRDKYHLPFSGGKDGLAVHAGDQALLRGDVDLRHE